MSTKPYDLEYREYVYRLVLEDGKVVAELSRELNIAQASIFRWLKIYKTNCNNYCDIFFFTQLMKFRA